MQLAYSIHSQVTAKHFMERGLFRSICIPGWEKLSMNVRPLIHLDSEAHTLSIGQNYA